MVLVYLVTILVAQAALPGLFLLIKNLFNSRAVFSFWNLNVLFSDILMGLNFYHDLVEASRSMCSMLRDILLVMLCAVVFTAVPVAPFPFLC